MALAGSPALNFDMASEDEDDGGPTFAAITARSYHPGDVNALFGDGSVRFIKSSINWQTWRALGTIGGGEVIASDSYLHRRGKGGRGPMARFVSNRCHTPAQVFAPIT